MNPAGDEIQPLKNKETLPELASLVLDDNENAKTYKDPEGKDIIVTGPELKLLEHQKALQADAQKTGDAFIMRSAHHAYDAMKDAVSVNATFVDASMIEDDQSFIKQKREVPQLDDRHHSRLLSKNIDTDDSSRSNTDDLSGLPSMMGYSTSYMQVTTFGPNMMMSTSPQKTSHPTPSQKTVEASAKDVNPDLDKGIEALVKDAFGDDVDVETKITLEDMVVPTDAKEKKADHTKTGHHDPMPVRQASPSAKETTHAKAKRHTPA
jgi:hypothetical protein